MAHSYLTGGRMAGYLCCLSSFVMLVGSVVHAQSPAENRNAIVARFLDDRTSQEVRFPSSARNALGWTLRVKASSLATADTMRVELEFATTGGPTTREQLLDVRLTPIAAGHSPPQSSIGLSLPLQIPQGTDRIRFARHVPKSSFGNLYQVKLWEDGRAVPDGEATFGQPISDPDYAAYLDETQQNAWRALWIESDSDEAVRQKSLQLWSLWNTPEPFHRATTPQQWEGIVSGSAGIDDIHLFSSVKRQNMPRDWRALRSYDAILIHAADWDEMQPSDAPEAIALRDWTHAGGVLIVRDASPKPVVSPGASVDASPTEEFLDTAPLSRIPARLEAYAQMDQQTLADQSPYFEIEDFSAWQAWLPIGANLIRDSLSQYPASRATAEAGVRSRRALAGMLIYLGPRVDDEPVQIVQWAAVDELMSWHRARLVRNGAEPILGSQRFYQWVIPGVAQPPVYTFMGLLGLFVILVGPVAYRKTAKAGRSYLMFAIAPALAMTTTAAMLGYGIISDGFGTRVRIRQITWVDGTTGDAFTRTRSTYFAGIQPADGLSFAPDAEITLYPDNQSRSWESRLDERFELRGLVTATPEAIRLSREFLPSRQQRQFVVHRPSNGWGRIRAESISADAESDHPNAVVKKFEDGSAYSGPATMRVVSETASPMQELLICDSQKRYFFLKYLAAGTTGEATRISREAASKRMGDMFKRQWLVSSIVGQGQTPSQQGSARRNTGDQGETTDLLTQQLSKLDSTVKPNEGVFEFELQQRMQLLADLPANSFLGISDLTADAVAIASSEVTDSIHYVFGSLP